MKKSKLKHEADNEVEKYSSGVQEEYNLFPILKSVIYAWGDIYDVFDNLR